MWWMRPQGPYGNGAHVSTVVEPVAAANPVLRRRGTGEILLVAVCAMGYSILCFLAPVLPSTAFRHAREVLAVERALGIDVELDLNLWLHAHSLLANIASTFYAFSFFVVTFSALALLWFRRPDRYAYARNALFVMTAGAMVTYWTFPLAPPRLLTTLGYVDAVANQAGVGAGYSRAAATLANQYGAMPSMHTGWAVWSALVLGLFVWKRWWQRLLLAIHPVFTVWVIIATANHYVLDALAGASYCAVALVACAAMAGTLSPAPAPVPALERA